MSVAHKKSLAPPFLLIALVMIALSAAIAAPAQAEVESTASCSEQALTQQFLSAGDRNWYAPAPGQDAGGFNGAGWTLSGGADIATTTGTEGQSVNVLNLPSGSKAVGPTICVTRDFPRARMRVRNVVGAEGVFFYVSYAGTSTWNTPKNTGQVHGSGTAWTLSDPVNLQPPNTSGWQLVKLTLVPGGKHSRFQVYDLYIDPFARH